MARSPGSIRRHGRGFEVRLCVAGRRHSYTVRREDRREAQQWAKQKEAELERQAERAGPERLTPVRMSELLHQFERDELPAKAPGTIGAYGDSLQRRLHPRLPSSAPSPPPPESPRGVANAVL